MRGLPLHKGCPKAVKTRVPFYRGSVLLLVAAFSSGCLGSRAVLTLTPQPKTGDVCAPRPDFNTFPIRTVAVAQFSDSKDRRTEKYTIHPKFKARPASFDIYRYLSRDGSLASAAVARALTQSARYKIIERRALNEILKEQRLQLSGLVDEATAVEVGRLAGADALLMGEVVGAYAQYTHTTEANGDFIGAYVGNAILNMRLVHVESGEIVWDCGISRSTVHYLDEPFKLSGKTLQGNANASDFALMGSTPEARIKSVVDAAARDALAYIQAN